MFFIRRRQRQKIRAFAKKKLHTLSLKILVYTVARMLLLSLVFVITSSNDLIITSQEDEYL